MKPTRHFGRIVIILLSALLFASQGNGESSPLPDKENLEANKRIVRQLFESVWNNAEFAGLDKLWAPQVTFHFRGKAEPVGPEDLRALVEIWRKAFPDFRFTVEDLVAESDRVAVRVRFTGTHTGSEWFGMEATGSTIDVTEMMFFRLQDGRVVEAWEDYDEYAMRRQLGKSQ